MPFHPFKLERYENQWKISCDANVNVIILKVYKIALVMMNIDDKTMKMNMIIIFEKVDDVNNENCKENNEEDCEDKDDDDEIKLVVLTDRNEKNIIMMMIISC
jgi:hypothetical protein